MTPIIVDSFAGGGGASTAIERALGRSPDVAINHSGPALALHQANHPDTLHLNSNIWDVEPRDVAKGRPVGLLWASPDCKHFSKARGGKPRDRNIRDLAWVVVKWADEVKPDVILMENVEEFPTWGPICEQKGQPIKELEGVTYEAWVKRIKQAGYRIQRRELKACDYGAPTIRKRSFWVMRRDGRPIVWPKPTHGDPNSQAVKSGKLKPWRTAAECIDWSLPCPSIFDTKAEIKTKHNLNAVRPLAKNTLARAARGIKRYVLDAERPFLVNLTHGGHSAVITPIITYAQHGGHVRDPLAPMHTICANRKDQNSVLVPMLAQSGYGERDGQEPRCLDPHAPLGTIVAGGIKHAPMAAFLAQHNSARQGVHPGRSLDTPMSTVTQSGSQQNVVASWFAKYYGTGDGARTDEPLHTITSKDRMSHMQATLSAPTFGPEHKAKARKVADLLRTHGYWDDREFVTLDINGETFVIVDVGMRMLTPRELFNAQGFPPDYVIEGVWDLDTATDEWTFTPFSKSTQVSCVGNSVCPDVAAALIDVNCQHLKTERLAA